VIMMKNSVSVSSKMRTGLVVTALLSTLSLSALAADEVNVAPGLTAAGAPLGLHGVDPVGVMTHKVATEGRAKHTAVHEGVAYYFSDAASLEQFRANPDRYIPQNGGFCTFGVSVGKKFDGDPQFSSIVDGKLYVFLNEDIYKMFLKDKAGTIAAAQQQWQKIKHTQATEL